MSTGPATITSRADGSRAWVTGTVTLPYRAEPVTFFAIGVGSGRDLAARTYGRWGRNSWSRAAKSGSSFVTVEMVPFGAIAVTKPKFLVTESSGAPPATGKPTMWMLVWVPAN